MTFELYPLCEVVYLQRCPVTLGEESELLVKITLIRTI